MKTVAKMIEELRQFPPDAVGYAYEGGVTGIIIVEAEKTVFPGGGVGRKELGYIPATEDDQPDGDAELMEAVR